MAEKTSLPDRTRASATPGNSAALRIVLYYACFASLWILLSDKAVALLFTNPAEITIVSMLKGWLFVGVTSLLLFLLIRNLLKREREEHAERLRALQLLESIANSSTDAIFAKDRHGRYILFNQAAADITGTTPDAILGRDDTALFPPEQAALVIANDQKVMESNRSITFQEHLNSTDGRITFLATKGPLRNEEGEIIGMFGISRDISEHKQAEREREITVDFLRLVNQSTSLEKMIKASTKFFQHQSGCVAVGIRLKSGDDYPYYESCGFPADFIQAENSLCCRNECGQILRNDIGNPVLACMCGNVLSGRFDPLKPFFTEKGSFWTNSTSELLATTTDADRQVRTRNRCNGEGYESVALIGLSVGEYRIGLLQLNDRRKGIFTPEKISLWERLAGYLAVALAKFQAEHALRESEERLHLALRSANMGVWEWNIQTDEVIWSPECYALFGLTHFSGNLSGFTPMIYPDDVDKVLSTAEQAIKDHGLYIVEFRVIRPDNTTLWVTNYARADYDQSGKPLRMVGIVQDITRRKQAEDERGILQEQLLQSQKMESVGRLAGGVAHDFNNMLAVIFIALELIKMKTSPADPIQEHLHEIMGAATRARDITRQLLAFSRKQVIAPQVLDLNQFITDAEKPLARLIGEDIRLRFVPAPLLGKIRIDPSQIDQVLMNLAVNARDAMPDGGNLTIETANVEFDEVYCRTHAGCEPGHYVQLAVTDEGAGMSEEVREHVFEPFFTTKGIGKGTGLGLATIYGIVQQNQGIIHVYSEVGHGSTFKLCFPRVDGEASASKTAKEVAVHGEGSILLVEDDEILCRVTQTTLETLGYSVTAAQSPEEALRIAEDADVRLDLLLTDVVMPGMNGQQLREQISLIRPHLKVLFMSGYTSDAIVQRGVLDDGVQFIQKPFAVTVLAEKLKAIMKNKDA